MGFQALPEVIDVIGFVRQQATRWGNIVEQDSGNADVGDIARRHDEGDLLALSIGQSVDFAGLNTT